MTCFPSMWPHFFGATWSSRWIAATPAASKAPIVRITFSGLPYPVSASAITGMSTQSAIRRALSTISVMVSRPTSGRPSSAADVPNPVMYTAGKPASSTSRAASGSNAPGATMVSPDSSNARSRAGPPGRGGSRPVTGARGTLATADRRSQ